MKSTKAFFIPIIRVMLFIFATVGGAQILYSEVIFPGYNFLPFEIYNPILDMTLGRFLFRIIFFIWSFLLYLFLQFILSRHKWKDLIIAAEKHKIKNFFKGAFLGITFIAIVIIILATYFYPFESFYSFSKDTFFSLIIFFIAVIVTAFFLELIFRGVVLNHLKNFINFHVANLITSTLFAAIFVFSKSDYYPIKQFFFSLFLGYTFYKYGYYAAFGFHFGWNYLESIFFNNTIFNINLIRQTDFTPLTADSLTSTVILLIGNIIYLLKFKKKKNKKSSSFY